MARLLTDCGDAIVSIHAELPAAGFISGFTDLEWARESATAEEWADQLEYERAFVREVVGSTDTSLILFSDPGQYQWRTKYFTERVQRRFDEHGSVANLLKTRARRHLVELTKPGQRLMQAIEGQTLDAMEAVLHRHDLFERAYKRELKTKEGPIADARAWWSRKDVSVENLFEYFLDVRRTDGASSDPKQALMNFSLADGMQLAVRLDARIEGTGRNVEGAFFIWFYARAGAAFSSSRPPADSEFVPFAFAFPNKFSGYKRFENKDEFVLCAAVWRETTRLLIGFLKKRGW
jgi:hypothetical protein